MTHVHSLTLTVITPVLNGERFISGCLDSVLAQGCAEVEHLVVDGGSTDSTESIVRERAAEHASIRWLQEQGANQSHAMNLGVDAAFGRIVGILNVDDFYEPGVLPRVVDLFRDLPRPALAVGNCNTWESDTLLYVNRPAELRFEKLLLGPDLHPFPFNPSAYFYDRSLHDLVGGYDERDEFSMDLDFLLRAVRAANAVYVDETWGNYRVHPEAKTARDRQAGAHDARRDAVLRRYRRLLPPRERARHYAELGLRTSQLRARRARWRLGTALAARRERRAGSPS